MPTFSGRENFVSGDMISVALDSETFDAYIYIYDAAGTELLAEDYGGEGNNALAKFIAPADGDYTILARGWSSSAAGDYTLTVIGIAADELTYNTPFDVGLDNETFHFFKFEGMEGDVLNIIVNSGEQDLDMVQPWVVFRVPDNYTRYYVNKTILDERF